MGTHDIEVTVDDEDYSALEKLKKQLKMTWKGLILALLDFDVDDFEEEEE